MSTEPDTDANVVALEDQRAKRSKKRKSGEGSADPTSDATLARLFVDTNVSKVRYEPGSGKWMHFDGPIWRPDHTDRASALMLETASERGIGSAKKIYAAKGLAQLDQRIIAPADRWNADPYLLGTPRGIVDLRTGKLLPPSPIHLVSMSTSVGPIFEPAPTWLRFLDDATRGDPAYQRYLQQCSGYWLTGLVNLELFWFIYGDGGGGKGTYTDTLAACLGDYGWKAASRTLLASQSERHLTEIAAFQGRRMVYISETPTGREWDIARLKELTGGDPINANRMRHDPIMFLPTHKLVAMGNHAPSVPMIDNSIRRRFQILPFDNIVPEQKRDPTLKQRLRAELPQILAWAIAGTRDMLENGLAVPEVVRAASEDYFSNEDGFSDWIAEKCYRGERHEETSSTLLTSWNKFRKNRGEDPENAKSFAERMRRAGFIAIKKSGMWWQGLALNDGAPQ